MNVQITSTTDSKESVDAVMGAKTDIKEDVVEKSAAEANADAENTEESEASEEQHEESSESEEASEDKEDKSSKEEGKKKSGNGFKKRIDGLRSKLSAKDQEVEYWKEQALKNMKSQDEDASKKAEKPSVDLSTKPKEDDFESHADYIEALTDWKIEQREKIRDSESKQQNLKSETQRLIEAHQKRLEAFVETHEDFDEAMEPIAAIPMSVAVEEAILTSENGPELMYELAKDPEEYKRICKLPALAAARAIGRVEARLEKSSKNHVADKKTTKAPPPPKPLGGKGAVTINKSIYDDSLSFKEYEALRAAKKSA